MRNTRNRYFVAILPLLACVASAGAEPPGLVCQTTITGFSQGGGLDVVVDQAGNAYLRSQDRDPDDIHLGFAVAKVAPDGETL